MNRILRNFAWLTAASIASQAIGAVALVFVSRQLGPGLFGMLAMAQAVANLGLTVADMGLGRVGTRMIASEDATHVGSDLVALRTCLNLVGLAVIAVGCVALRISAEESTLILASVIAAIALAVAPDFVWVGIQNMGTYSRVQILQQLLRAAGIIVAVLLTRSILSVPVATLGVGLLAAGLWWRLLPSAYRVIRLNPRRWLSYLVTGLPIGLAAMMPNVYINSDTIMVRAFLGFRALGQYAAAYRLLLILLIFGGLLATALFPEISRIQQELERRDAVLRDALLICMAVAIPAALLAIVVPGELMQLVYGSAYASGAGAVRLLLLVPLLGMPNLVLSAALVAAGDTRFNLAAITAGGLANLALNVLLLPRFGIAGAATATLCAESVVLLALYARVRPPLPLGRMLQLAAAGAAAFLVLVATRSLPVLASAVLMVLVYVVCLARLHLGRELLAMWQSKPRLVSAHA